MFPPQSGVSSTSFNATPETMSIEKRSNFPLLIVIQLAWLNGEYIDGYLLTDYFVSVCVYSQIVSFSCPIFCPEVSATYHCVITSTLAQWDVSGSASGSDSYLGVDPIGMIRSVGSSFTANKTGSTSFSLNFNAEAQFNNSVNVTCIDAADPNSNTNSKQCTIKLEGKREKDYFN